MNKQKIMKRALIFVMIILVLGIVIQLVPVDRTNPLVTQELSWNSPNARNLAVRACFDCHSNETKWPWYSYIAPISWLIAYDVKEGRGELNFSEWGKDHDESPQELCAEIEETIRNGSMPPWNYVMANPKVRRLSVDEKEDLIQGFRISILKGTSDRTGIHRYTNGHFHHHEDDDD